jgi:YhcH/YjgK/YiaL family protein
MVMIYDVFTNMKLYFGEKSRLHKALDFAVRFDRSQSDGRYEVDGDKIYALVMTYSTKSAEELKFEAHKKYIDIQLLLEGREFLDVTQDRNLNVEMEYSDEKDAALFTAPADMTSVLLGPGNFAVLYPDDIHRPGRKVKDSKQVRKMVIKVRTHD